MKNVCRFSLSTDIETNPGPIFHVDPSKTICAPYSQGNQVIIGETAGQQCLSMCLCALIYNKKQGISSSPDLIQIMNIGNELYSNLSHLARQSFLMFTELPSYLTVFETDYLLTYSEIYSGRVTVTGNVCLISKQTNSTTQGFNAPRSGLPPFPPFDPMTDSATVSQQWKK